MPIQGDVESYIRARTAGRTSETGRAIRAKLRYLTNWLHGDSQRQPHQLAEFQADLLERGLSPWTCRTVLTTVRGWARWAEREGRLPAGAAAGIVPPKPPSPRPKGISPENVRAMLAAALAQPCEALRARDLLILYLLRDTGARAGGLAHIEMGDIDRQRRRIVTTEKGDKVRQLYLSPQTMDVLSAYLFHRPTLHPRDDHLLITLRGTAMTRDRIGQVLTRLADAAGLHGHHVNAHAWRHAFARDTLLAGADLSTVSQLLGHSTIRVTAEYYARWADSELQDAHDRYSPGLQLPLPGTE